MYFTHLKITPFVEIINSSHEIHPILKRNNPLCGFHYPLPYLLIFSDFLVIVPLIYELKQRYSVATSNDLNAQLIVDNIIQHLNNK